MISLLIKEILTRCELRQKDLAEVLEVPLQRVKRLSGGDVKNLTREEGENLIRKLNIRAEWLATGEGEMFRSEAEVDRDLRLEGVYNATSAVADLDGLSREEKALAAMVLQGVHSGNAELIQSALNQLSPIESKLIAWYRMADNKGKKAIEATAKALARK